MNYLRQLCAVVVLTVLFAITALAGETPCPGISSPLPQPSAEVAGETPCPGAVDPVTEVALTLFQSVLALF